MLGDTLKVLQLFYGGQGFFRILRGALKFLPLREKSECYFFYKKCKLIVHKSFPLAKNYLTCGQFWFRSLYFLGKLSTFPGGMFAC